jgi:DNA invertase Pin-like site-specific DNA recombinase
MIASSLFLNVRPRSGGSPRARGTAAKPSVIPCAIYTRKSSEEGLQQDFNSLDAQREACAAFILSQRAQGWKAVGTAYDDGGFSGGNMERPALKRLLADIAVKKIRIVVVYKVDRLTRSLADFAKLVELFDAHGVSFVSVTQQFNTTSSMGRLTLNVLLSFAQFEREVTGERIRDKIAASKRKGMWMGGIAPIGYLPHERSLVIDEPRAEQVRAIYRLYRDLGCVRRLKAELDRLGWRTPARKTRRSDAAGGCAFSRGHLYRILSNPVYLGRIVHNDQVFDGQHPAIIDEALWTAVQNRLANNAQSRRGGTSASHASLLRGRVYDAADRHLSPSHARKGMKRYRYYVRPAVVESDGVAAEPALRIPAAELETAVVQTITTVLNDRSALLDLTGHVSAADTNARLERAAAVAKTLETDHAEDRATPVRALVSRVTVHAHRITVKINLGVAWGATEPIVERDVPARLRRCGMAMRLVVEGSGGGVDRALTRGRDPHLVGLLSRAHEWFDQLKSGHAASVQAIARAAGMRGDQATRIVHLAFLAPDLTEQILRGAHPADLTRTRLLELVPLPTDWAEQRVLLGMAG